MYKNYDDVLIQNGLSLVQIERFPFECYKIEGFPNILLAPLHKPIIKTRRGRLLFNIETKQFCFGLEHSNSGMVALTVTDKGEFWNGLLFIVVSIKL